MNDNDSTISATRQGVANGRRYGCKTNGGSEREDNGSWRAVVCEIEYTYLIYKEPIGSSVWF